MEHAIERAPSLHQFNPIVCLKPVPAMMFHATSPFCRMHSLVGCPDIPPLEVYCRALCSLKGHPQKEFWTRDARFGEVNHDGLLAECCH